MLHVDRALRHAMLALLLGSGAAQAVDLTIASRRTDFERLVKAVEEDHVYLQDGGHCWADARVRVEVGVTPSVNFERRLANVGTIVPTRSRYSSYCCPHCR